MFKTLALSKGTKIRRGLPVALTCLFALMLAPSSQAALIGTVPTPPGSTVIPGFVTPGTAPGTLLASEKELFSFSTTAGTTSGFVISAVFQEAAGTLDFYYQVENDPTSSTSLARETNTNFASTMVSTGWRIDGSTLPGAGFADGTVVPVTADSNNTGSVIGFSFNPPEAAKIAPGLTSYVLVISTTATNFTAGNLSVIDGGTATLASYQPASPVPEPMSFLLLGGGLLAISGFSRLRRS